MDNNKQKEDKLRRLAELILNSKVGGLSVGTPRGKAKELTVDAMIEFSEKHYHSKEVDLTELKEKFQSDWSNGCFDDDTNHIDKEEVFNFFLPYLQQPAKSEWISVEDDEPKHYNLVSVVLGSGAQTVGRKLNDGNWLVFKISGAVIEKPHYWKELSESPFKSQPHK